MIHEQVISLQDAKTYLGLDDTARDAEVKRMVKSAINWVEKRTNHIMVAKNKLYPFSDGCVRVYDFPITKHPDSLEKVTNPTYCVFNGPSQDQIELSLGYDHVNNIPEDLVECSYMMLKFFFYEQEGSGKIPQSILNIADQHRRFII